MTPPSPPHAPAQTTPSIAWPDWTADFCRLPDLIAPWAQQRPDAIALSDDRQTLTWRALVDRVNRVAAALQAQGLRPHEPVAMLGRSDAAQVVAYLAVVVAGGVAVPLPQLATPQQWARMLSNCGARWLFVNAEFDVGPQDLPVSRIEITAEGLYQSGGRPWGEQAAVPAPASITPDDPFNIIYSSGTTGEPKGIVQGHRMRWMHIRRGERYRVRPESVMLIATPLYSNTTLVAVLPALAAGGRVHMVPKFSVAGYLALASSLRATHTMLVPVQYQRLMADPAFDQHDLSAFDMKLSTSAPFRDDLKADILRRWPGDMLEIYGMTEGGGTFMLDCKAFPDKLHTVGQPTPGHLIRLLDEEGRPLEPQAGRVGEVVGHSLSMMTEYYGDPARTADAQWFDEEGRRYIRTGDLGCFDEDGFLMLRGRRKDMIISGGFNIYPSDLESVMRGHPSVGECAVVGVPSEQWGETPVAYVVLKAGASAEPKVLMDWLAERVGRTQRLSDLVLIDELPRNAIGKVDKVRLRAMYAQAQGKAPGA
jgi:acyl-CoA synthetase (AMP-forming)/AMP-acid ligase II